MKKNILLLCLIIAAVFSAHAQSIYHFKYHLKTAADTTGYDALFVSNDNGSGSVRIKFRSPQNGEAVLIDMQVQEDYPDMANGIVGPGQLFYRLSSPRFIRGKEDPKFMIPVYWFKKNTASSLFEPWGAATGLTDPQASVNSFETVEQPAGKDLQRKFVLEYYNPNEPFYQNLFETKTRGLSQQEKSTRLILLLVANIRDPVIGSSCQMDKDRTLATFRLLTSMVGIQMDTIIISGNNYNKDNVVKAIDALRPTPNDIVVFYYSGHGFRKPKDSRRFPYIDLRAAVDNTYMVNSLNVEDILTSIRKKGARLNLVITDCCNTKVTDHNAKGMAIPRTKVLGLELFQENVRTLFFNPNPTSVIATAADVDQKASSNDGFGGFFSYFFKQSMEENLGYLKKNVSWDEVLLGAQAQTERKARHTYCDSPYVAANICEQVPYYKIITGR